MRYNGFLEDRLDLGDVVVVGGLRYDWYDSRASRPFVLDTVSSHATFCQYSYFPTPSSYGGNGATSAACNGASLVQYQRDQSHNYLSPHIQVSFPVTDRTNFRLSYAHQVQAPDFNLVLGGINTDLRVTNTNHVYGSDLDFGKTIAFEFGIRHAFSDDMVLDISAYNRDNLSDAAGRLVSYPDPSRLGAKVDLRVMTNADFGNTRGIDLRLDRRIGRFFNGVLAYTFQDAKNTGSDPFTYINFGSRIINQISGGNQPPPQGIFPTGNSRPHNLTGSFALTVPTDWKEGTAIGSALRGVGVTALFRYSSGTAYTKCPGQPGDNGPNESVISGGVCAQQFEGDFFGARRPSFKQLDMKFTKSFGLGGLDITGVSRCPEHPELQERAERLRHHQRCGEQQGTRPAARRGQRRHRRRGQPERPVRRGRLGRSDLRRQRRQRVRQLAECPGPARRAELRVPDPGRRALRQRRSYLLGERAAGGLRCPVLCPGQRGLRSPGDLRLHGTAAAVCGWASK